MKRELGIFIFLMFFVLIRAEEHEKIIPVNNIRGEYTITADSKESMKQATLLARKDAKHKALIQACGERINIWDMIESSTAGESFSSLSLVQVNGEIVEFTVKNEDHEDNPARKGEIICYCIADVKVKKGVDPDLNFKAEITGIKNSYIAGTGLTFKVKPHDDCYLKVFIFEDEELGYMLYPNTYEKPKLLAKDETCTFPIGHGMYDLYTDKNIETDRLVFVFTKLECPFYQQTTSRSDIEYWIASIPNDQKFIYYTSINIVKK